MKKQIVFKSGIVGGDDMREFIKIFPDMASSFRQRHNFDEYYFDRSYDKEFEISIEQLDMLSKEFRIELNWAELIIVN
jgi:hypothetical protein